MTQFPNFISWIVITCSRLLLELEQHIELIFRAQYRHQVVYIGGCGSFNRAEELGSFAVGWSRNRNIFKFSHSTYERKHLSNHDSLRILNG